MRIVVGVDGSEESYRALVVALQEARDHEGCLTVLQAWESAFDSGYDRGSLGLQDELQRETSLRLELLVADAVSATGSQVEVNGRAVQGRPADVLLAASRDADLLVVGSAGKGLIKRLLLGSVAEEVVRRADCPVMVVPASSGRMADVTGEGAWQPAQP